MHSPLPQAFFYLPSQELIDHIPASMDEYWSWIHESVGRWPAQLGSRDIPCTWLGPYNWVIQTFLYLKANGLSCELTASLPDEGIVITHGDFLPRFLRPLPSRFIVEIKPDRYLQCAHANFIIVQNRHDPICRGAGRLFVKSSFVKYWPQPGLVPRDEKRGDRFENICFMGNREQFIPDAEVLATEIGKLGLRWQMMPRERWHDYREVDAIIAVRPAGTPEKNSIKNRVVSWLSGPNPIHSPERKPASKLLNAWAAGTPAIVSPDMAYEDLRKSDLDFITAQNIPEILERLEELRDDPLLRRAMIRHGRERAGNYRPEKIVAEWKDVISKQILPEYRNWNGYSVSRRDVFFILRALAHLTRLF